MKPLYELVAQHKQLEQMDPEDIPEEVLLATLEGLEGEIAIKATSCAAYIRNIESFAEAVEDAAKKMRARAELINKRAERVRAYLMQQLDNLGETKIQTPEFTIQIRKNPHSLVIDDIDKIPSKFKYFPLTAETVDKMALKDALDKGEVIPGAHLHQGRRIAIKE